jgi:hypothetical protein
MIRIVAIAAALVLLAASSTARAQSADAYQLAVIKGSSQLTEVVVREQIATGQSVLSVGFQPFISVAEPAPLSLGVYRLFVWETIDNGTTNRAWNCYRLDTLSGRLWHLVFDGTTASWTEIVAASK